jgi:hypothetical protein
MVVGCQNFTWGNNLVTIQGNGTIRMIVTTKHLRNEIKKLEVLMCHDFQHKIINDEDDVMFKTKLKLPKKIRSCEFV